MDKIAAEAADKICNAVNMEMHDSISYAPREQILTIVESALSQSLAARDKEIEELAAKWREKGAELDRIHQRNSYAGCANQLLALLKWKAI